MKKSLRFCVLLALAATLLTVSAFADTGPKAQLKVLVKNVPEEPYYLDLLEKVLLWNINIFCILIKIHLLIKKCNLYLNRAVK